MEHAWQAFGTLYNNIAMSELPEETVTGATRKPWYESKMIWFNLVAIVALAVQSQYGFIISQTEQEAALIIINLILRSVTKQEIF